MLFKYRYDTETGLYYLNSRYYNPEWGRFINADALGGSIGELLSHNMFAYCKNNSVNMIDKSGFRPVYTMSEETTGMRQASFAAMKRAVSNKLPTKGEPNSKVKTPNGLTEREYDENGRAKRDTDYGHPDNHPELESPHYHDWKWDGDKPSRREPYNIVTTVLGVGLLCACVVGVVAVGADDAIGIGVADDFLLAPLVGGIGKGLTMIFGG